MDDPRYSTMNERTSEVDQADGTVRMDSASRLQKVIGVTTQPARRYKDVVAFLSLVP